MPVDIGGMMGGIGGGLMDVGGAAQLGGGGIDAAGPDRTGGMVGGRLPTPPAPTTPTAPGAPGQPSPIIPPGGWPQNPPDLMRQIMMMILGENLRKFFSGGTGWNPSTFTPGQTSEPNITVPGMPAPSIVGTPGSQVPGQQQPTLGPVNAQPYMGPVQGPRMSPPNPDPNMMYASSGPNTAPPNLPPNIGYLSGAGAGTMSGMPAPGVPGATMQGPMGDMQGLMRFLSQFMQGMPNMAGM